MVYPLQILPTLHYDGAAFSILESGANNEKIRAACFDELKPEAFAR